MLVLGANGTAIMAALPTMRDQLGLSATELGWAINAYLIASAACIIPGGKAADSAGARRVSILGLALFAVASLVVAAAPSAALLLCGRALQGLAAALAVPGTLAAIGEASAPVDRADAIGAWAGFLMLGFSVGPLIGGALTRYADWRVIFLASGAAMLAAAAGLLRAADTGSHNGHLARFDLSGFALLALSMVALISALHALPSLPEAPLGFTAFALLAVAAGAALSRVERRSADPIIDGRLFTAGFMRAVIAGSVAMCCILMLLLYYNLEAQAPRGLALTAVGAGLSLLPMSAGLLVFAFFAPRLIQHFGPRRVLTVGMVVIAASAAVIAVAMAADMWIALLIGLFAIGAGLALPYATAPRLALAALPAQQAGAGSGIINACTFLGGSVGVAAGAIAFAAHGLTATMGLIAALALIGAGVCRGLPVE